MPKLLFLTLTAFYPDAAGGGQIETAILLSTLKKKGWEIQVICGVRRESPPSKRRKAFFIPDEILGYRCWRNLEGDGSLNAAVENFIFQTLRLYEPDVVLSDSCTNSQRVQIDLLYRIAQEGYPAFYYVRNVDEIAQGGLSRPIPEPIRVIADTPFTASVVAKWTPNEVGVILGSVHSEDYQVAFRKRKYVTFVNPIPQKGVEVAVEISRRMPDRQFLFVKGKWPRFVYQEGKDIYDLPNVEVWEFQADMRRIYEVTDILLVPSQFMETFGRVILEAQINGIPVVASDVGGISYTLGKGGILIREKEDPQAYVAALRKLQDETVYKELSSLAFENSKRKEFDPESRIEEFEAFVKKYARLSVESPQR